LGQKWSAFSYHIRITKSLLETASAIFHMDK
jgi:hypothetical protein